MKFSEGFSSGASGVDQQASYWFSRSRSGDMAGEDRSAFERWLNEDAEHGRAFAQLGELWAGLEALRAQPTVLAMREGVRQDLKRRRQAASFGRAAAVVGLCVLTGAIGSFVFAKYGAASAAPTLYATAVGEMSNLGLPDGSSVVLDTDSALRVWPAGGAERRLELVRGRAFFKVAKDPSHPFVVVANRRSVTALGTEFDVYLRPTALEVNLVEGRLRVRSVAEGLAAQTAQPASFDMTSGYRLVASPGRLDLSRSDTVADVEWREGRLVFNEQSVADIAAELNRYTSLGVIVSSPEVGGRRISAVFKSSDISTFVAAIEAMGIAKARRTDLGGYELIAPTSKKYLHPD
jgi:transmembrane sensor